MYYLTDRNQIYWGKYDKLKTKVTLYEWNNGNWQLFGIFSNIQMLATIEHKTVKKMNKKEIEQMIYKPKLKQMNTIKRLNEIKEGVNNE